MGHKHHIQIKEQKNNVFVVTLTDKKIIDDDTIGKIGEELAEFAEEQGLYALVGGGKRDGEPLKVVIDFTNVENFVGDAFKNFLAFKKRLKKGDQLLMANAGDAVSQVYDILLMKNYFNPDPEQSVKKVLATNAERETRVGSRSA